MHTVYATIWVGLWLGYGSIVAQEFPQIVVKTLDDKEFQLPQNYNHLVFFFDAASEKHQANLSVLNQVAYAFRMNRLQVSAVYSELENLGLLDLEALQKEFSYLTVYQDIDRQSLNKFGVEKVPALFLGNASGKISFKTLDDTLEYAAIRKQVEQTLGFSAKELPEFPPMPAPFVPEGLELVAGTERLSKVFPVAARQVTTTPVRTTEKIEPKITEPQTEPKTTTPADTKVALPETNPETPIPPITTPVEPTVPSNIQGSQSPSPREPLASGRAMLPIFLAATVSQDFSMGPRITQERTEQQPLGFEDACFFTLIEVWIKLLPLAIWGWGILYCLAKIRRYSGMLWGLLACLCFFVWHLWYVWLQLPYELCILSPQLLGWIQFSQNIQNNIFFLEFFPGVSDLSYWKPEMILILLFQCALVRGLCGRFKSESETR